MTDTRAAGVVHTVVLASAGTGKTWQLTGRFQQLLRAGVAPEQILATTFTRAAAGQILDRVLARLADAADRDAAALALLGRVLRQLDQFQVMTLDAVFLRLLWALGPLAGFGAGLGMAEDWDDQRLRADALELSLEGIALPELVGLLRSLMRGGPRRSVHAALLKVVDSGWAAWLDSPASAWQWLDAPPVDLREAAGLGEQLASGALPRTKAGSADKRWEKACTRIATALASADWQELCGDTLVVAAVKQGAFGGRPVVPPMRDVLCAVANLARAALLRELADENRARHELLGRFARHYRRLQAERGLFRFDDLPRLLQESATGAGEPLLARVRDGIAHLLLDEFQDTSVAQWRALRPLAEAILHTPAAGTRTLFCVGDLKQSIYGWRSGEPRLLERIAARPEVGTPQRLDQSYRCAPAVLAAVNQVFGQVAEQPCWQEERHAALRPAAVAWQAAFAPHTAACPHRGRALLRAAPAADADQALVTLRCAAARVAAIHRAAPWATIGLLVRRGRFVPRLLFELQQLGVRASGEGGSPLVDSAAVLLALSLLHLADHPEDSAAWFHLTSSPLATALLALDPQGGVARPQAFAGALRQRLLREGCGAVLQELRPAVEQCAALTDWDRGRFAQLLELLWRLDERPGQRLSDLVQRVRSEKVESPRPCAVQVMTVHAAKGLEFDAVVLADLDAHWFQPTPELWTLRPDPEAPLTRVQGYVKAELQALDPGLSELAVANGQRLVRECLCVLYVAMTRARRHLEMVVAPERSSGRLTSARLLRDALAPTPQDDGADADDAATAGPSRTIDLTGDVLWTTDPDTDWERAQPETADAAPASAVPALRLAAPAGRGTSEAPSRRGKVQEFDVRTSLELDDAARRHGILVHRLLQEVEWLEEFTASDAELLALLHPLASGRDAALAVRTLRAALRTEAASAALGRAAWPGRRLEVWRERRFLVDLGAEGLLRGSFDRVVVVRGAADVEAATVIDFKTDTVRDPTHRQDLVEHYQPQLRAYRRAVAVLCGLSVEQVKARLWFLADGALV